MEYLNYDAAKAAKHTHFQGDPCKHGHTGIRYTNSKNACVDCHKLRGEQGRRQSRVEQNKQCARHYINHRIVILAKEKAKRENDPNYYPKRNAYRRANPDIFRALHKRSRIKRKSEKPEIVMMQSRAGCHRRRARLRGAETKATTAQIHLIRLLQGYCCAYCGSKIDIELDHKIPLARGGHHTWANLQWLCKSHNSNKRITPDDEYRSHHNIPAITQWDSQYVLLWMLT